MWDKLKEWGLGVTALIVMFAGVWLLGAAFRAYTALFAALWIAVPIFAGSLCCRSFLSCFTLVGVRRLGNLLLILAFGLSFLMFASRDHVRNSFGKRYIEGYRYWRGETDYDDIGRPFYVGDNWTAKTPSGRTVVGWFDLALLAGTIALPAITYKATRGAISRKEAECNGDSRVALWADRYGR